MHSEKNVKTSMFYKYFGGFNFKTLISSMCYHTA